MSTFSKRLTICRALLVVILVFIWGNSLMPAELSEAFSGWVKEIAARLLPFLSSGNEEKGHHILRKIAHFSEFAALGATLLWLARLKGWKYSMPLVVGICAACVDEWIQLWIPGRAGSVTDVALDSCGVLAGMILHIIGYAMYRRKKSEVFNEEADTDADGGADPAVRLPEGDTTRDFRAGDHTDGSAGPG